MPDGQPWAVWRPMMAWAVGTSTASGDTPTMTGVPFLPRPPSAGSASATFWALLPMSCRAPGGRPLIEELPLERAEAAYARMMSGEARFRVVLKIA